jgi:hypothetical protein
MRYELHVTAFQSGFSQVITVVVVEAGPMPRSSNRELFRSCTTAHTEATDDPAVWARDILVEAIEGLGTLNPTTDEVVGELGGCA